MPLTDQPGSVLGPSMAQLILVPAGKLSATATPEAVPALLLAKITVKPISEPALTLESSALSLMDVAAHRTVSDALACPEAALSAVKPAVLPYEPQLALVVLLTTCAWVVVIPVNVVGL